MFLEQDYEWFLIGPAAAKWHLNVFLSISFYPQFDSTLLQKCISSQTFSKQLKIHDNFFSSKSCCYIKFHSGSTALQCYYVDIEKLCKRSMKPDVATWLKGTKISSNWVVVVNSCQREN